jgi:hypothetical protein
VENVAAFNTAVNDVHVLLNNRAFHRDPIAWELWQVIKGTPLNNIIYTNYVAINDYTCDIDYPADVEIMERLI